MMAPAAQRLCDAMTKLDAYENDSRIPVEFWQVWEEITDAIGDLVIAMAHDEPLLVDELEDQE